MESGQNFRKGEGILSLSKRGEGTSSIRIYLIIEKRYRANERRDG